MATKSIICACHYSFPLYVYLDGNGYYVETTDERFKTGELKGNNAGKITITDGKTNKRIHPSENIPDGWRKGMTKKSSKGTIWINNGIESKMIHGEIPYGWRKGRSFSY